MSEGGGVLEALFFFFSLNAHEAPLAFLKAYYLKYLKSLGRNFIKRNRPKSSSFNNNRRILERGSRQNMNSYLTSLIRKVQAKTSLPHACPDENCIRTGRLTFI